ncbi:MAG: UDP-4-amino-4,6-dideoxy-N-acetyl-beta-L-altrosamine N-acetyltransferase [Lachnospiraceae bacterium]|nr:UDP-4-amino-4,6-dideoxy-N-acetyl-beta-L-altrosamine N-acetyltransferase [Lachnospiraceae bacterium]
MEIRDKDKKTRVINGADIVLRLMKEEDTDLIIKWRNTEFVRRNFIYQELFTRQGHENWVKTMIDTGRVVQFIILRKMDDKPVGSVYLRDIDRTHSKAEYGIFIGEKEALGKGYGTQAARMMIEYAFHEEGLHKLMLRVLAENVRARRSYEKAGFVREAHLKDEVFLDGRYQDVIYMAVINDKGQEAFA